jgi:UDPglucose 6-dehydrogenase
MRVSIVGSGYVGLVTGAGLSQVGHHVVCMDNNAERVDALNEGDCPIYEPGLEDLLRENSAQGRLAFTTSMVEAVEHARILMIAVGTPPQEDGSADLQHVLAVANEVGACVEKPLLVVIKSTVPVGTCEKVASAIQEQQEKRGTQHEVAVASNPEFLKEGAAIGDFMKPDRIVVGVDRESSVELLRELYYPFNRNHEKMLFMDLRSSELTKYAANTMLATKISLMNELANVAEHVGADIEKVRSGIGSDPRIGYSFIYPGAGYGGSCFPKDIRALTAVSKAHGYEPKLVAEVDAVNDRQKTQPYQKLARHYEGDLKGRKIALWGLSFKPNTDDMREAPSLYFVESVLAQGAQVIAHDPQAGDEALGRFAGHSGFSVNGDPYEALDDADALVLLTEWRQYWAPDFERMGSLMKEKVIVDGRNIWSPERVRKHGFAYYSIGRP